MDSPVCEKTIDLDDVTLDDLIDKEISNFIQNKIKVDKTKKDWRVELSERAKKGDKNAKDKLVISNKGLVVKMASKFAKRGIAFEDLEQVGYVGVLESIKRFDSSPGYKFSTYAAWWIYGMMQRYVNSNSRTIRLPRGVYGNLMNILYIRQQLSSNFGRNPTYEELAHKSGLPIEEVEFLISECRKCTSLDHKKMKKKYFADENSYTEKDVVNNTKVDEIKKAINLLPKNDAFLVNIIFGLNGYCEHTFKEAGRILGVSKQRLNKRWQNIKFFLRYSSETRHLKNYFHA